MDGPSGISITARQIKMKETIQFSGWFLSSSFLFKNDQHYCFAEPFLETIR